LAQFSYSFWLLYHSPHHRPRWSAAVRSTKGVIGVIVGTTSWVVRSALAFYVDFDNGSVAGMKGGVVCSMSPPLCMVLFAVYKLAAQTSLV
jgi:hypothetical protein